MTPNAYRFTFRTATTACGNSPPMLHKVSYPKIVPLSELWRTVKLHTHDECWIFSLLQIMYDFSIGECNGIYATLFCVVLCRIDWFCAVHNTRVQKWRGMRHFAVFQWSGWRFISMVMPQLVPFPIGYTAEKYLFVLPCASFNYSHSQYRWIQLFPYCLLRVHIKYHIWYVYR